MLRQGPLLLFADFYFFMVGVLAALGAVFLENDFFFGIIPVPDGGVIPALAHLALKLDNDSRSFFGHFFLRFLIFTFQSSCRESNPGWQLTKLLLYRLTTGAF